MKLEELKSGWFGYQKSDVFQYITTLEAEFSQKLMEKDEEHRRLIDQYLQRIYQLEGELSQLKQQYEAQKNDQLHIADALLDAQRYREILQKETLRMEQEARAKLQEQLEEERARLERYRGQVKRLRELFGTVLQEMDGEAQKLELQAEEIEEPDWAGDQGEPTLEQPSVQPLSPKSDSQGNMTLFQRKNQPTV